MSQEGGFLVSGVIFLSNKTQGFGVELEVSQARQGQGQEKRQGQRYGILRFMQGYSKKFSSGQWWVVLN